MFKILRPDSEKVWKYQEIIQRFARYRGIIDNNEIARYLIAKSVQCDYNLESSTKELEEILAASSIEFNRLLKEPIENLKDNNLTEFEKLVKNVKSYRMIR